MAVLGFSNKTYAEAFANEQLEHWIAGHCHAFAFYRRSDSGRGSR